VYVNLEGKSYRNWCLGSKGLASYYLYSARVKLVLLGRGACLMVLVMYIWFVLPKVDNADNKQRVRGRFGPVCVHDYTHIL
jgi:type II secretory pathway component PulM